MSGLDDIEQALDRVTRAVQKVESAVVGGYFVNNLIYAVVMLGGMVLAQSAWRSRWSYAVRYDVPTALVTIAKEPHDCDFLAAPLGEKFCYYEPVAVKDKGLLIVAWNKVEQ